MNFNIRKNKDNVNIEPIKYNGDRINEDMKSIPEFLPKINFSLL